MSLIETKSTLWKPGFGMMSAIAILQQLVFDLVLLI